VLGTHYVDLELKFDDSRAFLGQPWIWRRVEDENDAKISIFLVPEASTPRPHAKGGVLPSVELRSQRQRDPRLRYTPCEACFQAWRRELQDQTVARLTKHA